MPRLATQTAKDQVPLQKYRTRTEQGRPDKICQHTFLMRSASSLSAFSFFFASLARLFSSLARFFSASLALALRSFSFASRSAIRSCFFCSYCQRMQSCPFSPRTTLHRLITIRAGAFRTLAVHASQSEAKPAAPGQKPDPPLHLCQFPRHPAVSPVPSFSSQQSRASQWQA